MADAKDFRLAILYGDDRFSMEQNIRAISARITKQFEDPQSADMNIIALDAGRASLTEIESAVMVISFFSQGDRLVVLDHLNEHRQFKDKDFQERLLRLFGGIPPSTQVVVMLEDELPSKSRGWKVFGQKNFLRKWAEGEGQQDTFVKLCQVPSSREMQRWIQNHARELKGKFDPRAAAALAELVGSDTAIAHQEILKCLIYVDYARPVEEMDVHALVSYGGVSNIFDMVDAMALGQTRDAQKLYHLLLEESLPLEIFAMIQRQFRLLIQAREIINQGGGQREIASRTHQHPYVVGKLETQARRFSIDQLEAIYRQLLAMDLAAKSGGMPLETSIDVLLFSLPQQ
jgi:DNA polymerase III subunit delta